MFPPSGMLLVNKIILEIMCSVIKHDSQMIVNYLNFLKV